MENGVNPEALAAVVKELKRETEALKVRAYLELNRVYKLLASLIFTHFEFRLQLEISEHCDKAII